jgi:hypothetical protein
MIPRARGDIKMTSPLVAVVLICSASIAVQDCSVDNATDVTYGESASTVFECLASGQALVASTALGLGLGKDHSPCSTAFF